MSTYDNAPPLDDWDNPPRELRPCCGEWQGTTHCFRCGHLIPSRPAPVVVEPVDDWPYNLIDALGTN